MGELILFLWFWYYRWNDFNGIIPGQILLWWSGFNGIIPR